MLHSVKNATFYSDAMNFPETHQIFLFAFGLFRSLRTWWTTARVGPSAATVARPTCVRTCSSWREGAASSVASAAVSQRVSQLVHV